MATFIRGDQKLAMDVSSANRRLSDPCFETPELESQALSLAIEAWASGRNLIDAPWLR
jgi:hypothetical protein